MVLVERVGVTGGNMTVGDYGGCQSRVLDHEILAVILREVLLQRGVKLLLHTGFVDVIERGGRLAEGSVAGPSGPEALHAHRLRTSFLNCRSTEVIRRHSAAIVAVQGGGKRHIR